MTIFRPFDRYPEVSGIVGRMLAAYAALEMDLLHCVHMGTGDFNTAFRAMFGKRGETRRIDKAEKLGQPAYDALGLGAEFADGVDAMRFCLKIRNQYAHCMWWHDNSGELAFANLEDIAANPAVQVSDLGELPPFHIDMELAKEQEAYFAYTDAQLAWVNFEGRSKSGLLPGGNTVPRAVSTAQPRLHLP